MSFFGKIGRFYYGDIRKYADEPNYVFLPIVVLNNMILYIKTVYPGGACYIQSSITNDVNLN